MAVGSPPDDSFLDVISKAGGFFATLVVASISAILTSFGIAYRAGKQGGTVEERVSNLTSSKIEARLSALEAWTMAHDKAVNAILDRFDANVSKISDRIDRLTERIDRLMGPRP